MKSGAATTYASSRACPRGHVERYKATGKCVACMKAASASYKFKVKNKSPTLVVLEWRKYRDDKNAVADINRKRRARAKSSLRAHKIRLGREAIREASAAGLKTFPAPYACPRGHLTERILKGVSGSMCLTCARILAKASNQRNLKRRKQQRAKSYDRNREQRRKYWKIYVSNPDVIAYRSVKAALRYQREKKRNIFLAACENALTEIAPKFPVRCRANEAWTISAEYGYLSN